MVGVGPARNGGKLMTSDDPARPAIKTSDFKALPGLVDSSEVVGMGRQQQSPWVG